MRAEPTRAGDGPVLVKHGSCWIQAITEIRIIANIMKFVSEISKIDDRRRYFFRRPPDFLQVRCHVKGHFLLCRFHLEGCVPCSPFRAVESAPKRLGMCKRCVNYVSKVEAGNQLDGANNQQSATLAEQPVVCGAFKFVRSLSRSSSSSARIFRIGRPRSQ